MYLLLIFFPLLGSCLSGFFGKQFGSLGSAKLTITCVFLSLFISIILCVEIIFFQSLTYVNLFYWIDSEFLNIYWSFIFDSLTIIMCFTVTFISFLVHLYSVEYMYYDPFLSKFMSYLSLFSFFMVILVTAGNLIQMFIGWEGVGLCSYLLINFWFTRIQANKAAIKAMILNRIGDFGLLIGILFIFIYFKSVDYITLITLIPLFKYQTTIFNFQLIEIISLFLFIGATGKSAQLGLHTWLGDAMEGPTPVSALIHAATMVTAGIFLIIRMSFLFEYTFITLKILILSGSLTALMGSVIGLAQNDFKKIIAYSTCSQLGYMIFSCGLSDFYISLFHLTNHAFFKALLFLCSGSVIHSINDEQDIRKMGGLKLLLPYTYITISIGSLALIGFPFLTGFYSKDFILESAFSKYNIFSYFSYFIGTSGAFITSFYSTRLLFLVFLSKPNGFKNIICYSIDSDFVIKFVLTILAVFSVFIGYYSKDMIVGFGSSFYNNSIHINFKTFILFDVEFISLLYKLLPINFSLFGFVLSFILYSGYSYFLFKIKLSNIFIKMYTFLNRKWFFDKLYNNMFGQFFFKFGYSISYKFIDRGIFEQIGPYGLSYICFKFSIFLHKLQTNSLYHLLLTILVSITFIMVQINFFKFFSFNLFFLNFITIILLIL